MGWTTEDTFEFWVPAQKIDVSKGGKKDDGRRWIRGVASTNSRDLQNEIVDQKGIDLSYFLKHGYFNDDHKDGTEYKVGEPTEAKVTKDGLWVKGFLYKDKKAADDIWEHLNSLESSSARRKLGFSIQGKVKRRDGNTIKECWIQDIAITPAPVNTTTWAEIAKSLSAQTWDISKSESQEEEEEKALTVSGGSPLVPESLDGKAKKDRTSKSVFTFSEAVDFLQKSGFSKDRAEQIAKIAFDLYS